MNSSRKPEMRHLGREGPQLPPDRHGRSAVNSGVRRDDGVGSPSARPPGTARVRRPRRRRAPEQLSDPRLPPDPLVPLGYERHDTTASLSMLAGNVAFGFALAGAIAAIEPVRVQASHRRHRLRPSGRIAGGDGAVGLPLLLGPPVDARGAPVLGQPRQPPLERALQPVDGAAPAVVGVPHVRGCSLPMPLLGIPGSSRRQGRPAQPAVPVLDPHRGDRPAPDADRDGVQHAVAPPRAPRREPAVPRQELRRHPDRVGQAVRHLRARGAPDQVRPDQEHPHLQPGSHRLPRVRRHRPRRQGRPAAGATASATCSAAPAGGPLQSGLRDSSVGPFQPDLQRKR